VIKGIDMSDYKCKLYDKDNSLLVFSETEEHTETTSTTETLPPWNVLIVDDEKEVHDVTRFVLEDYQFDQRGLNLISTYSAAEAKEEITKGDIALAIIDVVMETEHSGLDLIHYIRNDLGNNVINIILRTGQPGQAPEREVITAYEINDYKSKNELTAQKLFSSVTASLRNYRNLLLLEQNRLAIQEKNTINQLLLDTLPGIAMLIKQDGTIIGTNNLANQFGFTVNLNCFEASANRMFPLKKEHIENETTWEESFDDYVFSARWFSLDHDLLLFYALDITELKQKEAEKLQLEKQCLESQKMKSIGLLASGVAHDFNNILAAAKGYTELLMLTLDKESDEYSYTEKIGKATKNGMTLAKKLYFLARKEGNSSNSVDIHDALADVKTLLLPNCKKVNITLDLQAEKAEIPGDLNQLQNAFLNLGVNARDAMPSGGDLTFKTKNQTFEAKTCLGFHEEILPGDYINITIQDSGEGIPEDIVNQIFEPLFTTKKPGEGTGLGLAAVLSCIKNHNGFIKVESKLKQGTCFTVLLPVK
jgi:signal transduction histidine kinase